MKLVGVREADVEEMKADDSLWRPLEGKDITKQLHQFRTVLPKHELQVNCER